MSQGFEVDTGRLRQHAADLNGVQSQSAEAVDAGHQVTPGGWDNAYGVICQSFPQLLRPTAERGIDALQQVTDGLANHVTQLNSAADAYDELDRQIADNLREILRDLDRAIGGRIFDGH
ncbi:type VII secretion target [Amycolatopsis sp.]|uniref:type VII secretion target n=1 Tax=Amycolatopsis sp. TaxID=37632 RepID=UPI002C0684B5|nr:type VII secretion target [Amycolatopsis sp.]HVV14620.1 type VII secretion target [Amycolatopsis sp.]